MIPFTRKSRGPCGVVVVNILASTADVKMFATVVRSDLAVNSFDDVIGDSEVPVPSVKGLVVNIVTVAVTSDGSWVAAVDGTACSETEPAVCRASELEATGVVGRDPSDTTGVAPIVEEVEAGDEATVGVKAVSNEEKVELA